MRTICLAMILPLALLSCSEDGTPTPAEGGRAIGFTTEVTDADTRAAVLTTEGLKDKGFLVTAYYTGTENFGGIDDIIAPFMENQAVTWDGAAWTYSPAKYWPGTLDGANDGKLSFFAWNEGTGAEIEVVNVGDGRATTCLFYTVPATAAEQHDLVVAMQLNQTAGPVVFTFHHALSRIGFTATATEEEVTDITLTVRYTDGAVRGKGRYEIRTNHWSGNTHMSGTDTLAPGAYLMLIPQEIYAGAINIQVDWEADGTPQTRTLPLPRQAWFPGKCYTYTIKVSPTNAILDPVVIDPWDENPHKPCTITYYANNGTGDYVVRPWTTNVAYALAGAGMFTPPTGYVFSGWNTELDGSGDNYAPGEPFITSGDAELYAQWAPVSNCYMVAPGGLLRFAVDPDVDSANAMSLRCVRDQ
jgi:uncharacterized repeat protein (TIGR02543 family)